MIGVFGANSFIGQHLVRRFVAQGRPVRAMARRFDAALREEFAGRVDFVEADFRDSIAMLSALQDVQVAVQLVSSSTPGLGNQQIVADITDNVIPHVSFIQNAIAAGVSRYMFFSSGGTVYGPDVPVPTPETAPTNPINSHGLTKLMVEKYLRMYGHVDDLGYTVLRVSNPFGPGQTFRKGQGLIPAVLQRHREGRPITIIGDGQNQRDFIFIDDLVDAACAVIDRDAARNEVINIGSGKGTTVLEVIDTLERELDLTFQRDRVPDRKTDVRSSILDISKAQRLLGWTPRVSLAEGIRRLR